MIPGVENYDYGNADYVVEVPIAKRGGGLLNKTMACNSCGWEWKAADGGNDVSTCHKCGSSALPKAQDGGPSWDPKVGVDLGTIKESVKGRGQRIADIASSMEANEEDGGRPPASYDSVESLGGLKRYMQDAFNSSIDEDGLCRDNTCVQTVKDFYSAAGIEAIPKDVFNNREFLKNFKNYGFEEILDQKNLQPGDVLQYYYGPDGADAKEDPSYLNYPYHMGVYVNPGEYIGDGDSKAPIQRKNMYTGTKKKT